MPDTIARPRALLRIASSKADAYQPLARNHEWLVVDDPTGDFQGRYFTDRDLPLTQWAEGTIFRHRFSGRHKVVRGGRLVDQ